VRLLSWLIGFPIAVVAVLFAVSNKGAVTFALWPLPFTLEAPLYIALLATLAAGFTVGGAVAWAGQGRARRRARRLSDRVYNMEHELKEAQARAASAEKKLAEKTAPVSGEPKAAVAVPPGAVAALPAAAGETRPTVH
jgi:uncharacterized integral membrane protein